MDFEKYHPLKKLNSFGFSQKSEWYCEPDNLEDLKAALEFAKEKSLPVFILGGGSNIVLTADIPGLTIKLSNGEIHYDISADSTRVTAAAGVNWHALVMDTLHRGYAGLENLSLIPGNAGAAPIQNIGAYGVELADSLISVRVMDLHTGELSTLNANECQFEYRDSIFKSTLKNKVAIVSITLALTADSSVNTSYTALATRLSDLRIDDPTPIQVSEAVCSIRQSKLPDPQKLGNAGSFFKNPVVAEEAFALLRSREPAIPGHRVVNGIKVPAAWLIEQCGWKGFIRDGVGAYHKQPLVLVHFGGADGTKLMALAEEIRSSVSERYGITLEQEPQLPSSACLRI